MKLRRIVAMGALAGIMTFGIACGNNKTEEVPVAPVQTAEEVAIEEAAIAEAKYQSALKAYETQVADQIEQYTHTVGANEGLWGLVEQYSGTAATASIVDTICQENGLEYLTGDPIHVRDFDMYPDARFEAVFKDGKQVNCQLIYEGQALDFTYFAPEIDMPVRE